MAAMASGSRSAATASGSRPTATASGSRSTAMASGSRSTAMASGSRSAATTSGSRSAATASGSRSGRRLLDTLSRKNSDYQNMYGQNLYSTNKSQNHIYALGICPGCQYNQLEMGCLPNKYNVLGLDALVLGNRNSRPPISEDLWPQ
nr:Uncharacterised protein [Ipomoea batatas]